MKYQQINGHEMTVEAEPDGVHIEIRDPNLTPARVVLGQQQVDRFLELMHQPWSATEVQFADPVTSSAVQYLCVYQRSDGAVEMRVTDDPIGDGRVDRKFVVSADAAETMSRDLAVPTELTRGVSVWQEDTITEQRLHPKADNYGNPYLAWEQRSPSGWWNQADRSVYDTMTPARWQQLSDLVAGRAEPLAQVVEREFASVATEDGRLPRHVLSVAVARSDVEEGAVSLDMVMSRDPVSGTDPSEASYVWSNRVDLGPDAVADFQIALEDIGALDDVEASAEQDTDAYLDFPPRDALLDASRISSNFDRHGTMTLNLGSVDPHTEQVQWETLTSDGLHPDELDDLAAALRKPGGQVFEFRAFDSEAGTTGLVLRVDPGPGDLEGASGSDVRLRLLEESDGTGNEDSMDVLFDGVVTDDVAEELAADSEFAASVDDARAGSSQGFADADAQQAERAHRMVAKPATVAAKQPSVEVQARQDYVADPMRDAALAQPGQAAGLAGPA